MTTENDQKKIADWERAGYRALLWQAAEDAVRKLHVPLDNVLRDVLVSVIEECKDHKDVAVKRASDMRQQVYNDKFIELRKKRLGK
jgi:hypothetical protein